MLKNFIVIAYRHLFRRKIFSVINIAGLAIGIAASLHLLQYVTYERSYDTFHTNVDNIYRIKHDTYTNGVLEASSPITYYGAAPSIKESFPEVINFVRLHRADGMFNHHNGKGEIQSHFEKNAFYADSTFFDVFSFPLVAGDKDRILRSPASLVISESAAKKYFGNTSPIGKTISVSTEWEGGEFVIEGIFKDIPTNSHFNTHFIFSIRNLLRNAQFKNGAWYWTNFYSYLVLQPDTDHKAFQQKLSSVIKRHLSSRLQNTNREEKFFLQPIKDIHLRSNLPAEMSVSGDYRLISFLSIISFFILGIAWLNYINLSTAKAIERAREVGMRKVMGSSRRQLIQQFLLESSCLTVLSIIAAVILFILTAPYFNQLTGKQVSLDVFSQKSFWSITVIIIILGSFLSGVYPALVLSGFHPLTALKGKFISSNGGAGLRKILVVFQFGAAVILIIATMTVYRQLEFMRSQDLGLNLHHKVVIRGPRLTFGESYLNMMDNFKNTLMTFGDVAAVSASSEVPGKEIFWTNEFRLESEPESIQRLTSILAVDEDFIPAYEIKILAGRNFIKDRASDFGASVIINESALAQLGIKNPESVIDQKLLIGVQTKTIVGVIKDFHQQTLKQTNTPTIIQFVPWSMDYLTLSINTRNVKSTLASIEGVYRNVFPENAFEYFFLDDLFNQQYQSEERAWKIFVLFSLLAILVACLGLFGLSSFMAIQRTKEIAIRKILGATVTNLTVLLSMDFIKLVFISFIIATPISWYVMRLWLMDFAYRIDIPWWLFILSGVMTVLIALVTVSFQSIKTARTDPVKSISAV